MLQAMRATRILDALWHNVAAEDGDVSMTPLRLSDTDPAPGSAGSHAPAPVPSPSEAAVASDRPFSALPHSPLPKVLLDKISAGLDMRSTLEDTELRRRLFLAAALVPLRGCSWEEKKGKWAWAGEAVVSLGLKVSQGCVWVWAWVCGCWMIASRFFLPFSSPVCLALALLLSRALHAYARRTTHHELKLGNTTKTSVSSLFRAADLLSDPRLSRFEPPSAASSASGSSSYPNTNPNAKAKSSIGLLLRDPSITNRPLSISVRSALLFSLVLDLLPCWSPPPSSQVAGTGDGGRDGLEPQGKAGEVVDTYLAFWDAVTQWELEKRVEEKPLLDVSGRGRGFRISERIVSCCYSFTRSFHRETA